MESVGVCDPSLLISELMQGHELTRKLKEQLNESCSTELCKSLVQSITDSLEKAMSVAKLNITHREQQVMDPTAGAESPRSVNESLGSGSSVHALKDQERRENCKKRKAMEKWTIHVRVCTNTGLEGPPEDGFSWRKYGQKDIHSTKHPRAYYRCSHRHSQGCLSTKQVQRSDEDPMVFDITYRGEHSCFPKPSQKRDDVHANSEYPVLLPNLKAIPSIKTELDNQNLTSPSFSFAPIPTSHTKSDDYNHIFSSQSTLDSQFMGSNCISPFFLPATSEPDYFSMIPCFENTTTNLHVLESDLTEMFSAGTLVGGLDFELDKVDDPSFNFDASFF